MNPFEAYQMFLALRMHFTMESYNYFQYNGKVKANYTSFEKRRDNYAFTKLARHKDLQGLIVSNFIIHPLSASELNTEQANDVYLDWQKRRQSISYIYSEELKFLKTDLKENFVIPKNNLPYIIRLYLEKKISYETFIILLYNTGTIDYYDRKLKDNTLWIDLSFKVKKYKHFLEYNQKKTKEIIKSNFCVKEN